MELEGGYERPRVRPTPRRRRHGVQSITPGAPVTVEALEVYERNGDGHTVSRHCGGGPTVEADRLDRHRELPATGSFPDLATAQRAVEATVAANREQIEAWRRGPREQLAIDHTMDEVIGGVLRRSRWAAGDVVPRPASTVRAVLRRNLAYASGFAVVTAYPVRYDPPSRTLPAPPLPGDIPVCDGPGTRVGCDDRTLRRRLRRQPGLRAAASFRDRALAGVAVRHAVEAAGADVDDWLLCDRRPRLTIDAWVGAFLGVVLTRGSRGSLPAHSVHVVLRKSLSRPWGFRVAAAYPRLP